MSAINTTTAQINAFGNAAFNAGQSAGLHRAAKAIREVLTGPLSPEVEDCLFELESLALGLALNNLEVVN